VKFEEINIRQTPAAIRELQRLGVMATPALLIGDRVLVGYDPEEIDKTLAGLPS
jgi:protein-disulfide isomerase